jgi:hypothetical protein
MHASLGFTGGKTGVSIPSGMPRHPRTQHRNRDNRLPPFAYWTALGHIKAKYGFQPSIGLRNSMPAFALQGFQ